MLGSKGQRVQWEGWQLKYPGRRKAGDCNAQVTEGAWYYIKRQELSLAGWAGRKYKRNGKVEQESCNIKNSWLFIYFFLLFLLLNWYACLLPTWGNCGKGRMWLGSKDGCHCYYYFFIFLLFNCCCCCISTYCKCILSFLPALIYGGKSEKRMGICQKQQQYHAASIFVLSLLLLWQLHFWSLNFTVSSNKIFTYLIQILLLIASPIQQFWWSELGIRKFLWMLDSACVLWVSHCRLNCMFHIKFCVHGLDVCSM